MLSHGEPVTFAAVAKQAGVSNWLVYAVGVREHIAAARQQQAGAPARAKAAGVTASQASLRTELELSRADNKRIRAERDTLKEAMRRQLGRQLDQIGAADLITRINELTAQAERVEGENAQLRTENDALKGRLVLADDDLIAARTSLRQMIRARNAST
ncbi:hypothetical protein DMB66_18405 [Actinoplanes sp. ATCC 53533]|nr:hypothetical protein DMB66_18405 [Actinoplanes sp. ATCC 53533]